MLPVAVFDQMVDVSGVVGSVTRSDSSLDILVDGEPLSIPYRIYGEAPSRDAIARLRPVDRLVSHALFSRHSDGRVRQEHARELTSHAHLWWVAPFLVALAGEYVVEIIEDLIETLTELSFPRSPAWTAFHRFSAENPEFMRRTRARSTSYWNAYYRRVWISEFVWIPGCTLRDYAGTRFFSLNAVSS